MLRQSSTRTGIIVHTQSGPRPIGANALHAVCGIAHGYSNLEYDSQAGSAARATAGSVASFAT